MSASSSDPNEITLSEAYSILSLPLTASTAEIRKSYRSLSLKLHPDKARDVAPEIASSRFDRLQKAYEKLSDPVVREEMVRKAEEETKRKEKVDRFEKERKKMSDDLVMRERVEEEKRRERKRKERERHEEIQILKERGRKLKEQTMAQMAEKTQVETAATPTEPAQGPMDTTVRLLYPSEHYSQLSQALESLLTSLFGPLIRLHQSPPSSDIANDKKRKRSQDTSATPTEVSCLATFESLSSALLCVEISSDFSLASAANNAPVDVPADILDQVWVEWAAAREILKARKKKRRGAADRKDVVDDSVVKDEQELKGCKVGEPELVRYWRRFQPERLNEEVSKAGGPSTTRTSNGQRSMPTIKTTTNPKSSANFEADVLKRAMEVSRAKAAQSRAQSGGGDAQATQ